MNAGQLEEEQPDRTASPPIEVLMERLATLERQLETVVVAVNSLDNRLSAIKSTADSQRRLNDVQATMSWIAVAQLRREPLISVIIPSRDRCSLLQRAIASVEAQSYLNWEILIVDDASTDDTSNLLAKLTHPSIRTFKGRGAGACAARNIALSHARGEFMAYLDDDNVMHPQWLKSVAWAFEQWPQFDVLYGAFLLDNFARIFGHGDQFPTLILKPYDPEAILQGNIADMSAIAHRSGLAEGRFDETIIGLGDWDLFLRLTRGKPPIMLPAIACFYTSDAPNRLSKAPSFASEFSVVQAKNKR